jgi:hypothetical protein
VTGRIRGLKQDENPDNSAKASAAEPMVNKNETLNVYGRRMRHRKQARGLRRQPQVAPESSGEPENGLRGGYWK